MIPPSPTTLPPDRQARYLDRLARIRSHHRLVPLSTSSKPLATEISQGRSIIRPKPRRVNVSSDVVIEDQGSVTGKASINYYWASPVSEPTIAVADYGMMATGNWYAARSTDNGATFELVDPYAAFGDDAVGGGFCCDQVTLFEPQRDLVLWFMQGNKGSTGNNSIKLLVARGEQAFRAGEWTTYTYDSRTLLGQDGLWLDFPDMAVSGGRLYLTLNIFNAADGDLYTGTAVMRLSLDDLAEGREATLQLYNYRVGSLRLTQGQSLNRIYFAGHGDTGELIVRSWSDDEEAPSGEHRVAVERWLTIAETDTSGAEGPNRHPWIDRCDSRITAGWATNEEIGFAWTVGRDNRFEKPHVRVAIISRAAIDEPGEPFLPLRPAHEPHVWSNNVAIAYPATGINDLGDLGLSVAFGGPRDHPSHAVGFLKRGAQPSDWSWQLKVTRAGLNGPTQLVNERWEKIGVWGDYFSVRAHPTNPRAWVALGYTLQNRGNEALKAVAEYTIFSARGALPGGPAAESAAPQIEGRSQQ
ncbi:MAG: hypothetical protein ACT4OU_08095 [Hyphomicrobium sp.]